MIRYEPGEIGPPSGCHVPCGRQHQVIDSIRGRSIAIVPPPRRPYRWRTLMPDDTSTPPGCSFWQTGPGRTTPTRFGTLRAEGDRSAPTKVPCAAMFRQAFFADAELAFVRCVTHSAARAGGQAASSIVNEWASLMTDGDGSIGRNRTRPRRLQRTRQSRHRTSSSSSSVGVAQRRSPR